MHSYLITYPICMYICFFQYNLSFGRDRILEFAKSELTQNLM